jgi:hypothetical protein
VHINISYDFVRDGIMMILLGYDNFEENKQHTGTGTGDTFTSRTCGRGRDRRPHPVRPAASPPPA